MAPADGLTITILGFALSVCLVAIYIIRYRMAPRRSPAQRFVVREGKALRLAVGVMLNQIISTYAFHSIVPLRVTPTANRNSYRVARLVGGCLPRVACFARNPGLGKRNSYRVAAAYWRPLPMPSPRGGSFFLLCLRMFSSAHSSREGWDGACWWDWASLLLFPHCLLRQ